MVDGPADKVKRAARGYGVVFFGGAAGDREQALRERLKPPFIVLDCREISEGVASLPSVASDETLLILEIDELPSDEQTSLAQSAKGLAERRSFDGMIGFSASEPDAVVRAEPDLRMRVRSFEVGEEVLPQ